MTRPKDIGTWTTTSVILYLRPHGFPHAELRNQAGENDLGDIVGLPGVVVEVKGGSKAETAGDALVEKWLAETERERVNARADIGVLVMKRKGYGRERAGSWWAVLSVEPYRGNVLVAPSGPSPVAVRLHLADAVLLLRAAGYGDPLAEVA